MFKRKRVEGTERLGERFQRVRCAHEATLEEVSGDIHISSPILHALEAGEWDKVGSACYREQYTRAYAQYLGFSWSDIHPLFLQEQLFTGGSDESFSLCTRLEKRRLWVIPHMIRAAAIGIGICAGCTYIFFLAWSALRPPELIVFSPLDRVASVKDRVMVSGRSQDASRIHINGEEVVKRTDGTFQQDIALREGMNILHIEAAKKWSASREIERTVFFQHAEGMSMSHFPSQP